MNQKHRTLHLMLSSSVAIAFIISSYVFSGPFSFRPSSVDAASAESLLKSYATKDSDSDGLPDWQESLYGTDPANPESVKVGVLDGDAVAQGLVKPKLTGASTPEDAGNTGRVPGSPGDDTLTAQFARDFFTSYTNTYGLGTNLTDEQLTAFTESAVEKLVRENIYIPKFTSAKVTVQGSGNGALRTYIIKTEQVFASNTIPSSKNELDYMSDSIERNDPAGLVQVQNISKAYLAIANAHLLVPVPAEAKDGHLRTVNAMVRMSEVIANMGSADSDPVRSLLGLMQYQEAARNLSASFAELNTVLTGNGVVFVEGEEGYSIYNATNKAAAPIQP